jgi:hypothetical protein
VHDVLAALRGRGDKKHLADERRTLQRYLLRHHPAERVTENIHSFEAKRIHECECVRCHPRHVFRDLSRRAAQTGALKKNHLASHSKRIGHGCVPIIQGSGKVLKTQEW